MKPQVERDEVKDPGNYFFRKHFYALNIQTIVNSRKYFLRVCPRSVGSAHDSRAFGETRLFEILKSMEQELEDLGMKVVANSAYPLRTWLWTPIENPECSLPMESSLPSSALLCQQVPSTRYKSHQFLLWLYHFALYHLDLQLLSILAMLSSALLLFI